MLSLVLRIDTSVLEKTIWGTPEAMAKRFVTELKVSEGDYASHRWLAPGLYEFLHPELLNKDKLGGDALLETYQGFLKSYLQECITENHHPEIITQRFKINSTRWWKGLTQQQGISLICMQDVVSKSIERIEQLKLGDTVDIKNVYYKPLAYCALNLRLYFDWESVSPVKIIKRYTKTMAWGGEAVLAWWRAALAYVVEHQVKSHLESKQHKELKIVAHDIFWAGMDLIYCGFILPLQCFMQENLKESVPLQDLGFTILKHYLNARHAWIKKWDGKVDRQALLTHPLMQALATYPDESGWSPNMELTLHQHWRALESLAQLEPPTRCQFSGLPTVQKTCYFSEALVSSCFDNSPKFTGEAQWSSDNSQVRQIVGKNQSQWFIKVKQDNDKQNKKKQQETGLMAREYTAMMLHLLLGGVKQVALGWPFKLGNVDSDIAMPTYAWVSEQIAGKSLATVMRNSPEKLSKETMDIHCFSQLFLLSFLTCPEDGQPENFKVIEANGKTHLVAFDYGQCFVQAEHTDKTFLENIRKYLR